MKKLVGVGALFAVGTVLLGIAVFSGAKAEAAQGPCGTSNDAVSPPELELFNFVNQWRGANIGQPAMQISGPPSKAAQWFAEAMIAGTTSSHLDQYGRDQKQRLRDCGYDTFWAGGSGEALAMFFGTNPAGGGAQDALAEITKPMAGHSNGVEAPVPWKCGGVGYATNPNAGAGQLKHAWVVVTAQYGAADCPAASFDTATPTATNTPTATPTRTPSPTPTAPPVQHHAVQLPLLACDTCLGGETSDQ